MTTQLAPERVAQAAPRQLHRQKPKKTATDWAILAAAIVVGVVIAVPFLLILVNSFKSPADYNSGGPLQLPTQLYFEGIANFWERVAFPQKLWNSVFISGMVAVLAVLISVMNAYALGIGRVKARVWIIVLFLLANMIPQEALLYPLYFMFKQVGLYDNVWSVIIIFTVIQSAFGTYLLASVYGTFPKEVLEAASLDGASRWTILWRVIVPISRPTLSVILIFFF
ncbi:MAG: transporter, permease protein, partial [Cryobacterium sp.]|nr:transporter, permease protein [Cryobacterium sp.]